jgi:signal transduction histidine kinase
MSARPSIRLRLLALTAGIVALAVVIGWAARTSWQQFEELSRRLHEEELGSFHIADVFQTNILGVHYTLVRFGTGEAAEQRRRFEEQSQALNRWIDERKAAPNTAHEREILARIDIAYDVFLAAARHVITTAEGDDRQALLTSLDRATQASQPLLDLGTALATANRDASRQWREELRLSIRRLQAIIGGSLAGLLALGASASVFVYRQLVAPLRSELIAAREHAARQEKLAALGVLAAGVAHEVRNPLTSIKVRLYTLREELADLSVGEEDTTVIAREIERLEHIVTDFLQFARPSEPRLETLTAAAVLGAAAELQRPVLAARGIVLRVEAEADAPLRGDPRQLSQVLLNLIRNASESMPGAGTITLRVRTGSGILRAQKEACVFLDVADSGRGIPASVQARLFDPFFTTKETGTGLGLSIASRIVEAHGGRLHFETAPGAGTTFTLMLPRP